MPTRSQCFIGNSFLTTLDLTSGPVWSPLEQLAASVWQRPELPQFHPGEFMYMAAVRGQRPRVVIHLYKHIDSCCYLNLDEAGHAYAYRPRFGDPRTLDDGGRYRRYRSIVDALDRVDFEAFEGDDPLYRSFPPEEWAQALEVGSDDVATIEVRDAAGVEKSTRRNH